MTVAARDMVRLYCLKEFWWVVSDTDPAYLLDRYSKGNLGSVQHPDYCEVIIDGLENLRKRGDVG